MPHDPHLLDGHGLEGFDAGPLLDTEIEALVKCCRFEADVFDGAPPDLMHGNYTAAQWGAFWRRRGLRWKELLSEVDSEISGELDA